MKNPGADDAEKAALAAMAARPWVAQSRLGAQDLVVLLRGLPQISLSSAFDLDWDPALPPAERAERTVASLGRLREARLISGPVARLRADSPDITDPRLDSSLTPFGALWWAAAAKPSVAVEVTAWDLDLVRHGWFAARGDVVVGLVRGRAVDHAGTAPAPVPLIELDPIELSIDTMTGLVDLVADLWPDGADADPDLPAATLGLVDSEAFLLALAAGDTAVVDAVVGRADLDEWPIALRGLEFGVLGGVDVTVVARPGSPAPHRSTGHWILGSDGWRGLSVALTGTAGSAQDIAHGAQVRVTGQSLTTMRRALVLALATALGQNPPSDS
ncbi:hypothetical protein [Pengzhenrongella phosphoraccumulans]|uniref:hypothetical protein n=1 Tax=Pengzhenrongella phosphoraccumulans TaxID=3114394 RepID=UPI0038904B2D